MSFIRRKSKTHNGRPKRNYAGLRKVGKKGRENARALKVFKGEMARLGIDRCELRFEGCTGAENVTWAHGRKRRHLLEGELESFAVVACENCHWKAEKRGEAVMTPIIAGCIAERANRLTEAA